MVETHISVQDQGYAGASDAWLGSIMGGMQGETPSQLRLPRIPKVPQMLCVIESNQKCYEPLMVSIGPYYHGKTHLQEMENVKVTMVRNFVTRSGKPIQDFYSSVVEVAEEARSCYDKDEKVEALNDKIKFIQMMFLDGCFILQFIFCLLHDHGNLRMNTHVAALVRRDLFLLENQLPFQVLQSLMSCMSFSEPDEGMKLIKDFIKHIRAVPPRRDSCRKKISKFFRKRIWKKVEEILPGPSITSKGIGMGAIHLLEFFHKHFVNRDVKVDRSRTSWYRYHPAMELRRVGIHFKPSKSSQFTDVQFKPTLLAGRLQIPPLTIDDSTKSMLLNLLAYEACLCDPNEVLWVTSYICFMDSLIDHAEDVRELRSQGILLNTLGSDQEVAELFNQIANYLVPNPYAFINVKREIDAHYRNTFKRWILHYKGPVYTVIFKYSFIFGLLISALKYVKVFPTEPVYGICRLPFTNGTLYH